MHLFGVPKRFVSVFYEKSVFFFLLVSLKFFISQFEKLHALSIKHTRKGYFLKFPLL